MDDRMKIMERLKWFDIFDLRDGVLFWKKRPEKASVDKMWNKRFSGKPAGNVRPTGKTRVKYIVVCYNYKRYYAHRIIWEMEKGVIPENMQIDHIDGDGLNNSINNLRLVEPKENRKNLPRASNNTSGTTGVSKIKTTGKWRASISVGGEYIGLGHYTDKEDAINARKKAEEYYGFGKNHGR